MKINDFEDIENLKRKNLNLSSEAWKIIDLDMNNFIHTDKKQLSTFFNNVFTNFYQLANSSIDIKVLNYKKEMINLLGDNEIIINKLVNNYTNELINKLNENKVKVNSKRLDKNGLYKETKFKLNNNNFEILSKMELHDFYKSKDRLYLNSLFEEYTKLNGFEREKIYFKNFIDIFLIATNINKCKLSITLNKTNTSKKAYSFIFNPLGIYTEDTKSYGYLAGTKDNEPFVFRINRIDKMSIIYSDKIENDKLVGLNDLIKEMGIMYISGELNEYKVKLSDKGIHLFNRTLNMRPNFTSINNNIYTFKCTEFQFFNYFFKFGKEAVVISPISTKEKFINDYKDAIKEYEKNE